MSGFSALVAKPDPVDTLAARAVHRTERVPPGEWKLRAAVLEEAVATLVKYAPDVGHSGDPDTEWRQLYTEARQWVMAVDRGHYFSFVLICEALGLDPQATREAIRVLVGNALGLTREAVLNGALPELPVVRAAGEDHRGRARRGR